MTRYMLALAAGAAGGTGPDLTGGGAIATVTTAQLIQKIQAVGYGFAAFAGIIAVLMLIWAGVRYITSGGNSRAIEEAYSGVRYTIIGLIVAGLAAMITGAVVYIIGH